MIKSLEKIPRVIAGGGAIVASIFTINHDFTHPVKLIAAFFLISICITDTLSSKIPNIFTATCLFTALLFHGFTAGSSGLYYAGQGLILGFLLLLWPYLAGGMGAGDVKALAVLGSLIGPGPIFQTFLYMGLIGGVMAIFHYALSGRLKNRVASWVDAFSLFVATRKIEFLLKRNTTDKLRFPYAAAIAFGYFSFLYWGPLINISFL